MNLKKEPHDAKYISKHYDSQIITLDGVDEDYIDEGLTHIRVVSCPSRFGDVNQIEDFDSSEISKAIELFEEKYDYYSRLAADQS